MLTPTDLRVLDYLRDRRAGVTAIGAACFHEPGKAARSGSLPAAAHLARMERAGLIAKSGGLYERAAPSPALDLFKR